MLRTFWPATTLSDLPQGEIVRSRLSDWVTQWFSNSARLYGARVVPAPNFDDSVTVVAENAIVAAASLGDKFLNNLRSRLPSALCDSTVMHSYITDMMFDLCSHVFVSTGEVEVVMDNLDSRLRPEDMLEVAIQSEGTEEALIVLFVSAEIYFKEQQITAASIAKPDKRRVMSSVPVSLSIEKLVSVSASDLVNLTVDDFVPIADVGHVGFEIMVSREPVGIGYVGHIDNSLAIVIES